MFLCSITIIIHRSNNFAQTILFAFHLRLNCFPRNGVHFILSSYFIQYWHLSPKRSLSITYLLIFSYVSDSRLNLLSDPKPSDVNDNKFTRPSQQLYQQVYSKYNFLSYFIHKLQLLMPLVDCQ